MHRTRYRATTTSGVFALLLLAFAGPGQAQVPVAEYAERRAALAQEIGDGIVLGMGSAAPPFDYLLFFQNSPFRYLTGLTEPDGALVLIVEGGRVTAETLFVNRRDPAVETWEGYRVGVEGVEGAHGLPGRAADELEHVVDSLLSGRPRVLHVVGPYAPDAEILNDVTQRVEAVRAGNRDVPVENANDVVAGLRAVKSDAELDLLRRSTAITVQAHREALGAVAPARNEFEVQALIEYTFRRYGAERSAFASIVGSGPNSTVLHYNANDRFMEDGDVVVMDIGASYEGYAADITRTLPVNGRFSDAQRDIYQLVRDAQSAAEEVAGPGVSRDLLSQAATRVLAEGLARLGLIEGPAATFDGPDGNPLPQLLLYYMHGLGHGTGLDVHDPWPSVLEPGVVFTIEPGVYVRANLFSEVVPDTPANRRMQEAVAEVFERYVNIGVRIEDDYIVTADGLQRISPAPREIEEIEAAMAEDWTHPEARNQEWVEWYRGMR
ncbi:MAG: aminopeptidase P N-terminal domain-containing protein [Gemmatimonadota bacterium]